ncbi:PQ-loop repeat-containing protein 3 [Manacus vitellinus]|uniref:PQ-loop repeat-containing protein 3 n=1 Tax=Manacus vitellinus TaxID=328815 RepID=UPI00115F0A94|nr:PQ-loop repeat-containing protein 3 [Manacus vitellinus]
MQEPSHTRTLPRAVIMYSHFQLLLEPLLRVSWIITRSLFWGCCLSFIVFLRYQIYYGYPLQTYLEYPIIIAQDVILLLCILHFFGKMKRALFFAAIFWGGWYMLTLQKWIIDLAMNLCTFISAASKLVQLWCLWQTKDSGQVSALTWSLSAYTCATRIFTTVVTTNDLAGSYHPEKTARARECNRFFNKWFKIKTWWMQEQ